MKGSGPVGQGALTTVQLWVGKEIVSSSCIKICFDGRAECICLRIRYGRWEKGRNEGLLQGEEMGPVEEEEIQTLIWEVFNYHKSP